MGAFAPTPPLARFLAELANSELRMLRIILEHQFSTAFRYEAREMDVRTMLVAPPAIGASYRKAVEK